MSDLIQNEIQTTVARNSNESAGTKFVSADLFSRAQKVSPGGVHSPVRSFKGLDRAPIFFKSGQGAFLTSVEGAKYIDYCQSFGPLVLGHRDPEVQEKVMDMIQTAWTFGACEPYSLELAEWITQNIPWVQKLRFVSSGTEAVMSALRVARAATGRAKILKFEGCYHGHADQLLVKSGSGLAGATASSSSGVPDELVKSTLVARLNDEASVEEIFQVHGNDIAAVIIEPLPANFGLLEQRPEFLNFLRKISQQYGALLIFDEVISGFRVALGGMAEITGITPDLVCYGKVIGGGFPVGCYGGRADLMDNVAPLGKVYQAGTLSANPVGMIAGLTTLKKMKRVNGWNLLNEKGALLKKTFSQEVELKNRSSKLQSPFSLHVFGSLFWLSFQNQNQMIRNIEELPAQQGELFKPVFLKALEKGLYLPPNAYEVGFISLAHNDSLICETANILASSLS